MNATPETPAEMKMVAAMLACPHQWGPKRAVRVRDHKGKKEDYDGMHSVCTLCGTNIVTRADGMATLFSPDGLSDTPPA